MMPAPRQVQTSVGITLPWACELAGGNARMLRPTFIRACQALRTTAHGQDKEDRMMRLMCRDCDIAEAVDQGLDFDPPPGITFFELEELAMEIATPPAGTQSSAVSRQSSAVKQQPSPRPADGVLRAIPASVLADLTLVQLRPYWKGTLLQSKKPGICPNCGTKTTGCGCGLCASCYQPAYKLRGAALLDKLAERQGHDQDDTPAVETAPAQDAVTVPDPDPVPAETLCATVGPEIVEAMAPTPPDVVAPQAGAPDDPAYACLCQVYAMAIDQAANGKGKARHAKANEPFDRQKICEITRRVGLGFPLGQAVKKAEESVRLDRDASVAEILGAMNYLAAAVIVLQEGAES